MPRYLSPSPSWRLFISLILLPLAAFYLQWTFWDFLKPVAWFFFLPVIFIAPSIGGFIGGVGATLVSGVLGWYFFFEPRFGFTFIPDVHHFSLPMFLFLGLLISFYHRGLLAREKKYRMLFENANEGIVLIDSSGRYLDANSKYCTLLGMTRGEIIGAHAIDHLPEMTDEIFSEIRAELKRQGTMNFTRQLRHKEGHLLDVEVVASTFGDNCVQAIVRDVSATLRYEHGLKTARDMAESANQAKNRFLANMSHEIRTPLNAILGFAQILEREPLPAHAGAMVHKIRSAGQLLLGILSDILDLSSIESGKLRIENHPFQLGSLLENVASIQGSVARSKGLAFVLTAPPHAEMLLGDSRRLEQILLNLTGNAVKFTECGQIHLHVSVLESEAAVTRLRFEIRDSGVGIPADILAVLFRPFTQADTSDTRRFGGTGLGLAICKELTALMGGTIGADSTPGLGSTFWLELSFQRLGRVPQELKMPEVKPAESRRLAGLRLLTVDDSPLNQLMIRHMLSREGAAVEQAEDGEKALEFLRHPEAAFDAVLMDIQMPVMDGITALRAIRDELCLHQLPVIAVTAGSLPEDRQRALDAGMDDYIAKPVDLENLVSIILRLVDQPA